eukprot:gene5601-6787_t
MLSDDEYHTSLMRWLADRNGLQFGKDVVGMASSEAVAQQLFRKPGSIDAAAIFTRDPGDKVSEYEVYHSSTVPFGRFLVQLLPSFHYSRGFHLIMEHTSYDERKWGGEARTRDFVWDDVHTRNNATATAIAHGYSWSDCENDAECHTFQVYHSDGSVLDEDDLAEVERARVNNLTYRAFSRRYSGTSSYLHIIDDTPSLGYALEMLVMNVFLYVALAWYLGQVMSTNQGARLPPWFLLTREYWGFTSPKQYMEGDTLGQQQRLSASEQSIRMHKLSMAFEQSTALKELSLVIPRGEVLCLLGQNGAGKSTAINVLTGLLTATNGVAFVNGMDISTEVTAVRKLLGICPQDDILFEELTGAATWSRTVLCGRLPIHHAAGGPAAAMPRCPFD